MKRVVITVGLGVATAALGAGTAVAGCPTQDYPESEGWTYTSSTTVIPAGFSCSGAVRLFYRGHERTVETGPRTSILESGADTLATFTNVATGRTFTKRSDGDFYDRVVNNGRDLRSTGKGRNIFYGRGVRGIVYANGIQQFRVTRFEDPVRSKLTLTRIRGTAVELCTKLGLRPVNGKNPPPEEAPAP